MSTPRRYLFYVSQLYSFAILRPLEDLILSRGGEVRWFFNNRRAAAIQGEQHRLNTVQEVFNYNPAVVLVPGNIVPPFFPGIKVQLFHGFNVWKRKAERGHFRIRGFFDLYCTQGPATTKPFQKLAQKYGHFQVVETGWPKLDPLFAKPMLPPNTPPVILFSSTFTPTLSAAKALFPTIQRLAKARDWNWILTFHPKMDPEVLQLYQSLENTNVSFINCWDVVPLIQQADLLVGDTSSIVSEFLVAQKPAITFRNTSPGPHLINITEPEELEAAIEFGLKLPENRYQDIQEYVKNIHPYNDAESSARVLDAIDTFITSGIQRRLKPKPNNFLRKLKMRHKLNWWRFWK